MRRRGGATTSRFDQNTSSLLALRKEFTWLRLSSLLCAFRARFDKVLAPTLPLKALSVSPLLLCLPCLCVLFCCLSGPGRCAVEAMVRRIIYVLFSSKSDPSAPKPL